MNIAQLQIVRPGGVARRSPLLAAALALSTALGCIDRRSSALEVEDADASPARLCLTDAECDDRNPCTDDRCEPSLGCVSQPHPRVCDDGDACTVGDACRAGACQPGPPADCDDGDPCTTDACDPAVGCRSQLQLESWASVVIDGGGRVGEHSSLVVDPRGTLHVAYRDGEASALRYGRRSIDGGWQTERVEPDHGGMHAVISSAADGQVQLASVDYDDRLTHAVATPDGGWRLTRQVYAQRQPIDLAIDTEGRAYVTFIGARWQVALGVVSPGDETLEVESLEPWFFGAPSLEIDPERRRLYLVELPMVIVRSLDGGESAFERVGGRFVRSPPAGRGVAIDPFGRLHVAFTEEQGRRYAVREPDGEWSVHALPEMPRTRLEALAVDADSEPLIVYTRYDDLSLNALRRDGFGGWLSEVITRRPDPGALPIELQGDISLVFDQVSDTWHMTWFEAEAGELRHGWRCGAER